VWDGLPGVEEGAERKGARVKRAEELFWRLLQD
jgi:hypothetical protein